MKRYILFTLFLFIPFFHISAQEDAEQLIRLGIELHDQGKYKEAISNYKKALKVFPESMLLQYEIALSYLSLNNYKEAVSWSEKALTAQDELENKALIYSLLASAYDNWGKPEDAITIFDRGIKEYPDDYLLYFNKGIALNKTGRKKEALTTFIEALHSFPLHLSSLFYTGDLLTEGGHPGLAFYTYCFFLVFEPNTERSRQVLGKCMGLENTSSTPEKIIITAPEYRLAGSDKMDQILTEQPNRTAYIRLYYGLKELFDRKNEWDKKAYPKLYQTFYFPFFDELISQGHLETFCRRASAVIDPSSEGWIVKNENKVTDFHTWVNDFWEHYED